MDRIIVDSNILFSAILNLNSNIGQILINGQEYYDFYSPKYVRTELLKHKIMGLIKEPLGVDFIVDSRPLTEEEKKAISEYIKADKAKRSANEVNNKNLKIRLESNRMDSSLFQRYFSSLGDFFFRWLRTVLGRIDI